MKETDYCVPLREMAVNCKDLQASLCNEPGQMLLTHPKNGTVHR